jgi:hypothetical protein
MASCALRLAGFQHFQEETTMKTLSFALASLPYYAPPGFDELARLGPRRKSLIRPPTGFAFVAPLRQSLIRDPRLMPGTTRMLCLLAGWAGHGRPLETTLGAIGRNLGRSARQVQRYLRDAAEEGYLYVRQVTNRLGYVVGLRITLCRDAIYQPKKAPRPPAPRRKPATTQESDIKPISFSKGADGDPLERRLMALCESVGLAYECEP